jgi:hypothetical protein
MKTKRLIRGYGEIEQKKAHENPKRVQSKHREI